MYLTDAAKRSYERHHLPLVLAFVFVDIVVIYNILNPTLMGMSVFWGILWLSLIIAVVATFADQKDKAFLLLIATITFIFNVLIAVYFVAVGNFVFSDEEYYIRLGMELSHRWSEGGGFSFFKNQLLLNETNFGYYFLNALHFLLWPHKLLVVITNVGLKTLTGFFVYLTARKLYVRKIALVASCFIFFNPFDIFWASFDLKDTLICFLVSVAMYLLSTLSKGNLAARVPLIILVMVLIASTRFYLVYMLAIPFAGYLLLSRNVSNLKKAAIVVLLVLPLFVLRSNFLIFNTISETGEVEYLANVIQHSNENLAASDYSLSGHVSGVNLKSLVMSLAHFILTPSPFSDKPVVKFMTPGTLFWYFLFPFFLIGTYRLVRESWRDNIFLYSYSWLVIMFYTALPFLGSSRHRLMIMPFVAVLAAVGLYSQIRHKKLFVGLCYLGLAMGVLIAETVILA